MKNQYFQKQQIKIIECNFISQESKIAIIIPRFNNFINQHLLSGALDALIRIGKIKYENIIIIKIPGAYEIPIITNTLAKKLKYHGIITLGTIIKGETKHFDILVNEITSQILNISIKYNIPISVGILTTSNIDQAIQRSGTKLGNKGYEAAITILEMINLIQIIKN